MVDWTNDRTINRLKELVDRGLNAEQIGETLDTTKNSIIGKCRRLGLTLAGSSKRIRKRLTKSPKRLKKRLHLKPTIEEPSIKVKARKFLKVRSKMSNNDKAIGMDKFYERVGIPPIPDNKHCHMINGDDIKNGNHTWCNRPTENGSMYCEYHHKKASVSPTTRSRPVNYAPTHRHIR